MKKNIFFAVIIVLMLALSSCQYKGSPPTIHKSTLGESPHGYADSTDDGNKKPVPSPTVIKLEKDDDYKSAYLEEINTLIKKHGKHVQSSPDSLVKGVQFARLIDFENDKVPEMVVLCDLKVAIYSFTDSKVAKIYEANLGPEFGHTDVSTRFAITNYDNAFYVITYNSPSEWTTESITACTILNNKPMIKKLYAETDPNNEDSLPTPDYLVKFKIDEADVSKEDYLSLRKSLFANKENIDACWGNEPATLSNLDNFIKSLK